MPEIIGETEPAAGLRLTAVVGDQRCRNEHLAWALDAIELAKRSGAPAFTGRSSPHRMDLDHFGVLLRSVPRRQKVIPPTLP